MTLGRLAVSVLVGALALGGAVAALAEDPRPARVQAIDLNDDGAVSRRDDGGDGVEPPTMTSATVTLPMGTTGPAGATTPVTVTLPMGTTGPAGATTPVTVAVAPRTTASGAEARRGNPLEPLPNLRGVVALSEVFPRRAVEVQSGDAPHACTRTFVRSLGRVMQAFLEKSHPAVVDEIKRRVVPLPFRRPETKSMTYLRLRKVGGTGIEPVTPAL